MTPEDIVQLLAKILEDLGEFSEDDAYEAMGSAGISPAHADRAYKFTQIACGRYLLAELGVTFAEEYFCFNAKGEILDSGRISTEPYFAAATGMIAASVGAPWVTRLAVMSADVAAANEMLKKGSKPTDLKTFPPALFLENPTPAGMARADKIIIESMGATKPRQKKQWWRFWA